jgi:carbonic anhydrase
MTALQALEKLRQGNARFINNVRGAERILSQVRRADLVHGQNPFAVILGCSDARVPAEIVFASRPRRKRTPRAVGGGAACR